MCSLLVTQLWKFFCAVFFFGEGCSSLFPLLERIFFGVLGFSLVSESSPNGLPLASPSNAGEGIVLSESPELLQYHCYYLILHCSASFSTFFFPQ